MSRPPTLRERRHQQTRTELIESALTIIAHDGLDAATIDRVGEGAGISRGTVYAHFPSGRGELIEAAYARLGERLVDETRTALQTVTHWSESLDILAAQMLTLASNGRIGHFYNVTGPALAAEGSGRGIGSRASRTMITEIIESSQAAGELDPDVHAADTAWLLVGALREIAIAVSAGALGSDDARRAFARLVHGLEGTTDSAA